MKKLISIAAALSLSLSLTGNALSVFPHSTVMSVSAADDAADISDILPKKYSEMQSFIEKNGTVSIQDNYLVFCGNICDYSVMSDRDILIQQDGSGAFEEVSTYRLTGGHEDGSGNVVSVLKPVKSGSVKIMMTCADAAKDGGSIQCLIDRECVIGDDMSVTFRKAPSMENLLYAEYRGGYRITKAHVQLKGELDIPEKIGDVRVSAIPEDFLKYYDGITSVTIPETIDEIPESAFELCYDLKTITIKHRVCVIKSSTKTISNVYDDGLYKFTGTIRGYKNSTAEKYAAKCGYKFEAIDATAAVDGDLNGDGEMTVADIVLLEKWLLCVPDTEIKNWKAADFCEDDMLNVFDLCLMKREIINKLADTLA